LISASSLVKKKVELLQAKKDKSAKIDACGSEIIIFGGDKINSLRKEKIKRIQKSKFKGFWQHENR